MEQEQLPPQQYNEPQPPQQLNSPSEDEFKPNMYPIMYWALAYGAIAGLGLFLMYLLSRFITVVWVPVFLTGLIWGAYRNYQKQKTAWRQYKGMPTAPQSPMNEFREAAQDIFQASKNMMAEQAEEDAAATRLQEEDAQYTNDVANISPAQSEYVERDDQNLPPNPPAPPATPLR